METIATREAGLPAWDLSDLYSGMDAPELAADFDRIDAAAADLAARFAGKVKDLDAGGFAEALLAYESLNEALGRILSYAQLRHAVAVTDPKVAAFMQDTQERASAITQKILFFTLEINRVGDETVARWLADPRSARYAPWLDAVRAFRDHQLSDEAEALLHEREVVGRVAWTRLFDETLAAMTFPLDGRELTMAEVFDRLSNPDSEARAEAGHTIARVLSDHRRELTLITNVLAKDKLLDDARRGYARPVSPRNLANQVEDEVVDALVAAVKAAYPRLSHRYYALKAKWLGKAKLAHTDRNAPLPGDDCRRYSWAEAVKTVMDAYREFSPAMADAARPFFDHPWIDVPVRPGKESGAFAHPAVPSAHPYLLLNFMGRTRDVMTLAHELGHGVHQRLAAAQGYLLSDTPLTLAETASVFGEMLTFRSVLAARKDPAERRILLAGKVEDMLNTVVRQIAFHEFETAVHAERAKGEVSYERLCDIWMGVQTESLGPAFDFDDEYRCFWSYIPHFIHVPFYVYAYAFGDCLVNALYGVYRRGHPGFADKYLDLLRAGGTKRHRELLAPFGLDAGDPGFWSIGLDVIAGFIDELETLDS